MATIYYDDKSGKLVKGLVWQWYPVGVGDEIIGDEDIVYADGAVLPKGDPVYGCTAHADHETGCVKKEFAIDLLGTKLADFVPFHLMGYPLISEAFAGRLKTSGLTGFRVRPIVKITVNQSGIKNPRILYLEFADKGWWDPRLKIRGEPNACPTCGRGPLICPTCGHKMRVCFKCKNYTMVGHGFDIPKGEKRVRIENDPKAYVVEGKPYDGSDFFLFGGMYCVSNKAKDWMERTHTYPLDLREALLNVEGLEKKFHVK